jgi:hypothetical protein
LAARFLLTCPPRRPKRWTDADIDAHSEADLARLLGRLYDLQPTTDDDGQPAPVYVRLTPDAKSLWVDYSNAHGEEQAKLTGELAAAWSKLEAYAARLALIVHCARWAAEDDSLQPPDLIDTDSMARAVTLAHWFKGEARRVYGVLAETDEQRDRRQLADWIARKGGAVTVRALQQGRRGYGTAEAAEAALQELAKAGLGTWEESPTTAKGGRPSSVFRLPRASTSTQPTETKETGGFVDVDSVDAPEPQADDWGEI